MSAPGVSKDRPEPLAIRDEQKKGLLRQPFFHRPRTLAIAIEISRQPLQAAPSDAPAARALCLFL
jgi:hypothetical protein